MYATKARTFMVRLLLALAGNPEDEIAAELKTLRENHITHIYLRMGRVEGQVKLLVAVALAILGLVGAPYAAELANSIK